MSLATPSGGGEAPAKAVRGEVVDLRHGAERSPLGQSPGREPIAPGGDLSGMAEDPSESYQSVGGAGLRPFADLYHYLVQSPWPILLLMVLGVFTAANALFGLAYWFDGGVQGSGPGSYPDMFFFSVQTMSTIGYGVLHPTTFISNALVSVEALMGLVGLALMTGLVFAKFSLPRALVRFSRYMVVSRRDGVPSLMFRMANLRETHILEAQIHLTFSRIEVTAEGERLRRFYDLRLQRGRSALFSLSWTAVHQITPDSPLSGETPESLRDAGVMIVISLTGLEETFSQTVNARQYYGAEDVLWGKRLADITGFRGGGTPVLDYSRFDEVVDAPL